MDIRPEIKPHNGNLMNNPKHWILRAEEIRVVAAEVKDMDAKLMLLKIADDYEKLAGRAEQRAAGKLLPSE